MYLWQKKVTTCFACEGVGHKDGCVCDTCDGLRWLEATFKLTERGEKWECVNFEPCNKPRNRHGDLMTTAYVCSDCNGGGCSRCGDTGKLKRKLRYIDEVNTAYWQELDKRPADANHPCIMFWVIDEGYCEE